MMMFKTYGYISMAQGLQFSSDQKFAHYLKIPPRSTFWAQGVATLWCCIVQVAVFNWALGSIPNVCTPEQENGYTCPGANVFFTASVIWGVVGPKRIFGAGATYQNLQYFWLIGAALPVITYFLAKRFPRSWIRYIHVPVFFSGTGQIPPATLYNYLCWGTVGMFFNGFLKRKYNAWWMRYNYLTAMALDTGLAFCQFLAFFAITYTNTAVPNWYMNNKIYDTLDASGAAITNPLAPGQTFGAPVGSW